jgi:DNA-binding protein YbaB
MELFKKVKEGVSMISKIKEINEKLRSRVVDVEHKGVRIRANAKGEFLSLNISEGLLKEKKEKIEEAILGAFEKAREESQGVMAKEAKQLTGGMKFPGLS